MTAGANAHQGLLVSGRFPELEDALCERVAELKRDDALAPLTIVVGSAAVRTRIGDVLIRRRGAIANVTITTLGRLASDLVAAERRAPPTIIGGLVSERLVRRLVSELTAELQYFRPVVDRPRFGLALSETFADLREACVPPRSDWSEAVRTPSPAARTGVEKAVDLERLYGAFCAELEATGLLDRAGVPRAAAEAIGKRPLPGGIILFGIYDLNQAQEALVRALITQGADLFVPVPADGPRAALTALAVATGMGLAEQSREAPPARRDHLRLRAVWSGQGEAGRLVLDGDGSLAVVSVSDERAELREAVRAVMVAVEGGAPAWDCALVVPHKEAVAAAAAALEKAGLPAACAVPDRSEGTRLLLRLADCLSPAAGEPFSRRAVVDLLSAGPLRGGGEAGETAMWLDEARQAGVVAGPEQWTTRLARRRRGVERRLADLEARGATAVGDDDEVSEKTGPLRGRLAAVGGLQAAVGRLVEACGRPPERGSWGAWADYFAAGIAAVFERGAAEAACDAASRLQALAVLGEEVGLDEAVAALRDLLAGSRVPRHRVGRDGVAVVTPVELRGLSFHTVVFTGLAEGGFPARGRPDPLLGDAERRRVASALGVRLPLAEHRDAESLLLFAFSCEAARERLVLLAPRSSAADGRPRLPSRLLLRLASAAAGRSVGLDEFLEGGPLRPVWRSLAGSPGFSDDAVWVDERERDVSHLLALGSAGRSAAARAYVSEALGDADEAERRLGAWRSARSPEPGAWDGLLGRRARAALAATHPFDGEMHPTRLERYVGCPFEFLLRDVFDLQAPDEPGDSLEMGAKEFGTLAHEILQRTYQRVIDEGLNRDGAQTAVVAEWETCCAEAESRGVTGAALSWEVRRELLLEDLLETVRRDPVFSDAAGRTVAVEWRFGESAERPVSLVLADGRAVRFAGRLDRVDVVPSGARIIDYKSGGGAVERTRIKERLSVQLPVYRLALRQAGDGEYGSIACSYRLVTRRGGFEDLDLPEPEEASLRRLQELVSAAVALVDSGMFPRTTRQRCEYCELRYACGVSGWAKARKREHGALDPVVCLQSPPGQEDDDA